MKAEHRHELKTNELAEWLGNLPQWANQNSKVIIGLAAAIVVLIGFYAWRTYDKNVIQAGRQEDFTNKLISVSETKGQVASSGLVATDTSYELKRVADDLKNLSNTTGNSDIAAFALIKQAEALRSDLHYTIETPDAAKITEQINNAKDAYTLALKKSTKPVLKAIAEFGLGLCEEELRNFGQAKQIYQKVTESPEYAGTAIVAAAEIRLKTMSDYQTDITFMPAPVQQKASATLSQIGSTTKDVNLPVDVNSPVTISIVPPVETNQP
jgi:uncharacterized protein YciW